LDEGGAGLTRKDLKRVAQADAQVSKLVLWVNWSV
jgi:hypothetical protein